MSFTQNKQLVKFIAISYGLSTLVGAFLYFTGLGVSSIPGLVTIALGYMFTPLIAALLIDKSFHREYIIPKQKNSISALYLIGLPALVFISFASLLVASVYVAGNVLHITGVGEVINTMDQLKHQFVTLLGLSSEQLAHARLPSNSSLFIVVAIMSAVFAGLSVNALFAFGEEYGWRGFLWRELKHLGWMKANLSIGVLWGLWHAPIILQGYNFKDHGIFGVAAMVIFTTGASFAFSAVREIGNVYSSSALHGMVNGLASASVLMFMGGSPFIGGITGLISAVILLTIGVVLWKWVMPRHAHAKRLA